MLAHALTMLPTTHFFTDLRAIKIEVHRCAVTVYTGGNAGVRTLRSPDPFSREDSSP